MKRPPASGFTLIELLVVIAILAVLAALSIPVINSMQARAASSKSTANLRQIGAAIMQYAGDNNGAVPYAAAQKQQDGTWVFLGSWDGFLFNYIGLSTRAERPATPKALNASPQIMSLFEHPEDRSVITETTTGGFRRSYAMPTATGSITVAAWSSADPRKPSRLAAVSKPSSTILVMEHPGAENNTVGRTGFAGVNHPADQISKQPDLNGNGTMKYLFADGNIQQLKPSETIGNGTMTSPRGMWTVDPND